MRPTILNTVPWRAVLTWACLTFTVAAVAATSQGAVDTDGWRIPDGAAAERNPVLLDSAVLAKGQSLYRSKCQRCHGLEGKGNGPDADRQHAPSDLTDPRRASRNPDGVMFYKIWNGRGSPKMPAMKTDLARPDVWTIIHYVKGLRGTASSEASSLRR
jgi:mono/diheme cytochrome c family protein